MSTILFYVLFGLIVGAIANMLDSRPARGGIAGSIVLGIVGAVVGGFLGDLIFGVSVTGWNLSSFLLAIAGALLVLFVGRALTSRAY